MYFQSKNIRLHRIMGIVWGVFLCAGYFEPNLAAKGNDQDLYHLGTVHYQRGQWDYAIKRFEELLKKSENDSLRNLARFYLAESLAAKKNYGKAREHLKQFLEKCGDHKLAPQARFRLGEVCYLIGDREQALSQLGLFAERYPTHTLMEYVLPYLGELRIGEGELGLAAELFQRSLKTFPAGKLADESRFGLARALEKTESVNDAIRFYGYLIDHPESGRSPDSLLQLAKIYFRQEKFDESEKLLSQFSIRYPQHELVIPVRYWQGRIRYEEGDFSGAEKIFKSGLNADAKDRVIPAFKYELAKSLSGQKRYGDALSNLEAVVKHYPDSDWGDDALLLQIQILSNTDQNERAIRLCREFGRLFSESALARHVNACAAEGHFSLGNHEAAASLYEQLLTAHDVDSSPKNDLVDSDDVYENWKYKLAVCLIQQSENSRALDVLQDVDFENTTAEIQSAARLAMATIQIERNQLAAATNNLIAYVELNPVGQESLRCQMDVVLLLAKRGDFQKSDQWLQRLTDDSQAETALKAADLAFDAKQFVFSAKWYQVAAKTDDESVCSRALMGQVWSAKELGQIDAAVDHAGRLVKLFPTSKQADEALYMQAVLLNRMEESGKAKLAYEKLVESYPESTHRSSSLLALIPIYQAEEPALLKKLVNPLSQMIANSTSSDVELLMYELAWVLKESGEAEKSSRCFEKILQQYPDSKFADESILQLAILEEQAGRSKKATGRLKSLLEKDLNEELLPIAQYQLGQLLFQQGDYQAAITYLDLVAGNNARPDLQVKSRYWGAEASYRKKDWKSAVQRFTALCQNVASDFEHVSECYLRLGQASVKLEKWNDAIDAISNMAKVSQESLVLAQGEFVKGRAYSGLGLFSKSRAAYEAVLRNEETKGTETAAMAQWLIGESWFHQENLDKAIDAYQRTEILHAHPQWKAAALLQLAKCFRLKKDFDNAMDCCRRIVNDYSSTDFAVSAKELMKTLGEEISSTESEISNQKEN